MAISSSPKFRPQNSVKAGWKNGWHGAAEAVVSPNFGPRPKLAQIDLIVLHSISLPPGLFEGDAVQSLFTNQLDWDQHPYYQKIKGLQVSTHFFIRRCGHLQQYVSVKDRAWHAGVSSYRGRTNCNDDSVGIELEGIEGGPFEEAQYQALGMLCKNLTLVLPICHVAGHEHIAPGRKEDPGPGFDWARLQHHLRWPPQYFPEDLRTEPMR